MCVPLSSFKRSLFYKVQRICTSTVESVIGHNSSGKGVVARKEEAVL